MMKPLIPLLLTLTAANALTKQELVELHRPLMTETQLDQLLQRHLLLAPRAHRGGPKDPKETPIETFPVDGPVAQTSSDASPSNSQDQDGKASLKDEEAPSSSRSEDCGMGQRMGCGHYGPNHMMGDMDHGVNGGMMMNGRHGNGPTNEEHSVIMQLFDQRHNVQRVVQSIVNADSTVLGTNATTTSHIPNVARLIQTHVWQMQQLIDDERRIRTWDDLFAAVFDHQDAIEMHITNLEQGVQVVQTSTDTNCAARLILDHSRTVSKFIENGMSEMHTNHDVPDECQ